MGINNAIIHTHRKKTSNAILAVPLRPQKMFRSDNLEHFYRLNYLPRANRIVAAEILAQDVSSAPRGVLNGRILTPHDRTNYHQASTEEDETLLPPPSRVTVENARMLFSVRALIASYRHNQGFHFVFASVTSTI